MGTNHLATGQRLASALSLTATLLLAACGGGGSASATSSANFSAAAASVSVANSIVTGMACDGAEDEKNAVRALVKDHSLWASELPEISPLSYATPQTYFAAWKSTVRSASGTFRDQVHAAVPSAPYQAAQSGAVVGYGIQWLAQSHNVPRNFVVASVAVGSPAALAGVQRGDKLVAVDGVDFVSDNTQQGVDVLNAGLSPTGVQAHRLGFWGKESVSLAPAPIKPQAVRNVDVWTTASGRKVGTIGLDAFDAHSETALVAAVQQLQAADVNDLVIDLRYNGGGQLRMASALAYMVAGSAQTAGKTFEHIRFNAQHADGNRAYPFVANDAHGQPLPSLNLTRVTLLVTRATAAASESLINGLRGVDVQVDLVGDTTRGKPYGTQTKDHCGTTYMVASYDTANDKGQGDYAEGFAPTCLAPDDWSRALGSSTETLLKAALWHRETGVCSAAASTLAQMRASSQKYELVRPAWHDARVL